jgi:hypothetical protein
MDKSYHNKIYNIFLIKQMVNHKLKKSTTITIYNGGTNSDNLSRKTTKNEEWGKEGLHSLLTSSGA